MTPCISYPVVVGKVLRRQRKLTGVGQEELSLIVGISQATWSKIERGVSPLSVERLRDAALVMGVAPSELLADAERFVESLRKLHGIEVHPTRTAPMTEGFLEISSAALELLLEEVLGG